MKISDTHQIENGANIAINHTQLMHEPNCTLIKVTVAETPSI